VVGGGARKTVTGDSCKSVIFSSSSRNKL
jgi:hypothetical protein